MLLVTTAIEETWGKNEEILFLGKWCKLYSRKEIWQARKHSTLSYNWDDRDQLYSDKVYLYELYDRLLPQLSNKLNEVHGTCHSEMYWRILMGPWLGFFIPMLFQRWSSITNATTNFKITNTFLLMGENISLVPNDMGDFASLMTGDRWNHFICRRILKYQGEINCSILEHEVGEYNFTNVNNKNCDIKLKIKKILLATWNFCLSPFVHEKDFLFIHTYLHFFEEFKLKLRFWQVPQNIRSEPINSVPMKCEWREWDLEEKSSDKFEEFLRTMIPSQIPKVYLEGFDSIKDQTESLKWPNSPDLIFSSNSHIYDDLVKNWIASKVERGSSLVIGQHGGGPFHAINFQTEHELAICDRYLSPGEGNTWHPKVRNVGQIFARKWKSDSKGGVLLMQLDTSRYSFSIESLVQSDDFTKYMHNQLDFVGCLPSEIRRHLTIRLAEDNYQHSSEDRWRDRFPDIAIDPGKQNVHRMFSQSRLIVCTYAGTTYNQTIAVNAPTVIFWDPKYSQLHETTQPYLDELKRVGVFHETPESAAKHVSKIWDNIDNWWLSSSVQEVREVYCEKYACLSDDLLNSLEGVFRDVVAESRTN